MPNKNEGAPKDATPTIKPAAPVKEPAIGEEIDDLSDLKAGEENRLNSARFATDEEIKQMPSVWADIIHDEMVTRSTGVTRDQYYVVLNFDQVTKYRITLTSDEYGLIACENGKAYTPAQYKAKVHARVVGTQWEDGNVTYRIDVILSNDVRKSETFDRDSQFIKLFLKRVEMNLLTSFKPEIRPAQKKEN